MLSLLKTCLWDSDLAFHHMMPLFSEFEDRVLPALDYASLLEPFTSLASKELVVYTPAVSSY